MSIPVLESGSRDLTVVSNNAGGGDHGLAALIRDGRVRRVICSFPRQSDSWHFDAAYRAGAVELELVPQGTLAERIDPDLVNAGKVPVTERPGASYFHQADSFAMMRGGHLDICVLGAYQVSAGGDLANWHTGQPGDIPAVGGAMDLAIGARQTFVVMTLLTRDGRPKLVPACTYPLTGLACVSRVYTDLAVFLIEPGRVVVRDLFGIDFAELAARLDIPLADGTTRTSS
jgi:3-oxoadipate CoA-transferase beta subunit